MRVNVWTTSRREHRETLTKRSEPSHHSLRVWRQLLDLGQNILARAGAAVSDVMKLMSECVLKLLTSHSRIDVHKDRVIGFDVENETFVAWLDHWIDLGADVRVLR